MADAVAPVSSLPTVSAPTEKKLSFIDHQGIFHVWNSSFPKPPPRARTPYAFFVSDYYRRYRRQLQTRNPRRIIQAIVNHWRNLDPKTKSIFDKKSINDKERFAKEIAEWRSNFKDSRAPHCRRRRKNPLAPKRPRNPFIFYQQDVLQRFRLENPGMRHQGLISAIAKRWRGLSLTQREPYQHRYNADQVRYRVDLQQYRIERSKRLYENAQKRQFERLEALKLRRLQEKLGITFEPISTTIIVETKPKEGMPPGPEVEKT